MENNEVSKSNKIKIIVITALIFLVSIAGISYAYFTIQITGNDTASSMRLTTANMSLVYNDVQIVSGEYATPGWSDTKTLTVTNTGNVTVYYNIIWRDLTNEITNNELIMSMTCSSDKQGNTCDGISNTPVPMTTSEVHNISIKNNIGIDPGEKHTYTVRVTFPELSTNQNYNQGKMFRGTLNISEGKEPSTLAAGDEVVYGSEHFYVVSSNQNETVLLSKYNLLVGDVFNVDSNENYTYYRTLNSSDVGYGLQSSTAQGYNYPYTTQYIGVVPFSGTNYWDDCVCQYVGTNWSCTGAQGLKSEYANGDNPTGAGSYSSTYPYVYEKGMSNTAPSLDYTWNYGLAQNNGYTIAYYVEPYINKMKLEKNLPMTANGRLLTYEEADAFRNIANYDVDVEQCIAGGTVIAMQAYSMDETTATQAATVLCNGGDVDGATLGGKLNDGSITSEYYSLLGLSNVELVGNELYNSSFWLGSASASYHVWYVSTSCELNYNYFYSTFSLGVRPVIVVSTSDIGA